MLPMMMDSVSLFLVTVVAVQVHAFGLYAPCYKSVCVTDALTVSWTIDPTETFISLTADMTWSAGSSTTSMVFDAMTLTDSPAAFPASFLPGLQYGQTSSIDFGLYTGLTYGNVGGWYIGLSISSPEERPDTVTRTVTQSPMTVTASATESRTTSEIETDTGAATPTATDEADPDSREITRSTVEVAGYPRVRKWESVWALALVYFLSLRRGDLVRQAAVAEE
ncbi:hypothetical protein BDV06DRAFT_218233 [Aspergillus oleicola]